MGRRKISKVSEQTAQLLKEWQNKTDRLGADGFRSDQGNEFKMINL